MSDTISAPISALPRVLIADDSRIVRATLIKHIDGMFDFREALDGEQAWETILIDPSIRVVITDLTMPKLDGYGLLRRIRASKIGRIKNIPVIVISGNDEQEEKVRAKSFGATDLITKGIGTAQLLSRLDILTKLANTQGEFERDLEMLVQQPPSVELFPLASAEEWNTRAQEMHEQATQQGKNFVILHICIRTKVGEAKRDADAPPEVLQAISQLLHQTLRQTDCVARSAAAEFIIATGNIHFDSTRHFAQRICSAISNAHLTPSSDVAIIASCGMVSLSEYGADTPSAVSNLKALRKIAVRRALTGLQHDLTGVVGAEEEAIFIEQQATAHRDAKSDEKHTDTETPDMATLLQWMKEGKNELVMPHIAQLSAELQPLLALLQQHPK